MSEVKDIREMEQVYKDEWLLIEVIESDESSIPLKGKLLCHSKSRDEIHHAALSTRVRGRRYQIKFTGDPIPPDMVVIL